MMEGISRKAFRAPTTLHPSADVGPSRGPDVKRLSTTLVIDAPVDAVWQALVSTDAWPAWGPSVRSATLDEPPLRLGSTGIVTTVFGVDLRFEVTDYDELHRWSWNVARIPATDHTVEPVGPGRCRVGFGVPWPAAPYLAVCRIALRRLAELTTGRAPA